MVCGGFSNKVPKNTAMTEAGQCCCVKYKVQDDMEVNRRHRLKKTQKNPQERLLAFSSKHCKGCQNTTVTAV